MSNRYPTLAALIAAFSTNDNETGAARAHYDLFVDQEPVGPGVDEKITVITVYPHSFEYLAHRFGVDGNALASPEQVEAKKQYLVNEAAVAAERQRELAASEGVVLAPTGAPTLGGVA